MGFLPCLAENLVEQKYLGKVMVNVSQSSLPLKEGYVLLYSKSSVKVFKLHLGRGLVRISTVWSSVEIYCNSTAPFYTISHMK